MGYVYLNIIDPDDEEESLEEDQDESSYTNADLRKFFIDKLKKILTEYYIAKVKFDISRENGEGLRASAQIKAIKKAVESANELQESLYSLPFDAHLTLEKHGFDEYVFMSGLDDFLRAWEKMNDRPALETGYYAEIRKIRNQFGGSEISILHRVLEQLIKSGNEAINDQDFIKMDKGGNMTKIAERGTVIRLDSLFMEFMALYAVINESSFAPVLDEKKFADLNFARERYFLDEIKMMRIGFIKTVLSVIDVDLTDRSIFDALAAELKRNPKHSPEYAWKNHNENYDSLRRTRE